MKRAKNPFPLACGSCFIALTKTYKIQMCVDTGELSPYLYFNIKSSVMK